MRCFLVNKLVSPLLNRLYDLLNNRSLGNLSHRGKSISSSLREAEPSVGIGHGGNSYRSSCIAYYTSRNNCTSSSSKNTGENDLKSLQNM